MTSILQAGKLSPGAEKLGLDLVMAELWTCC